MLCVAIKRNLHSNVNVYDSILLSRFGWLLARARRAAPSRVPGFWGVGYGRTRGKRGGGYGSSGRGGGPRRVGGYGAPRPSLPRPCPRRARPSPRPPRRRRRIGGREIWWFPSTFCTNGKFSWQRDRLKRLPAPQKVAAQELIRKLVSNCTLLCVWSWLVRPRPSCVLLSFVCGMLCNVSSDRVGVGG